MKCPKCGKDITNESKARSKIYKLTEYHCLECYDEIKEEWHKKKEEKERSKGKKWVL
ncbi:MAG TPA: hypothetical protein PKL04_00500 [Methanofastidiosum sp.]|nr:hypothetical protein [Methanofastidiosum sp.]